MEKKIHFDIEKGRKLIDQRIRDGGAKSHRLILAFAGFAVVATAAWFWFLFYHKTPLDIDTVPEIVVPDASVLAQKESNTKEQPVALGATNQPKVEVQQVLILDTPTGTLNLRQGPSTDFKKIGMVRPGEVYTLLEQNQDKTWFRVKISNALDGWVSGEYAKIK